MQGVNKHSKRFIRRNCTSKVFNEEHLKEVGECPHKHFRYFWKATDQSLFTIVGDSIIKKIRALKYTDVQAFPGANTYKLLVNLLVTNKISVSYKVILIAIGTNDIANGVVPEEFGNDLKDLVETIFGLQPEITIGISGILPRLDSQENNEKVLAFNSVASTYCNKLRRREGKKIYFL